jgi:hypothetical protein
MTRFRTQLQYLENRTVHDFDIADQRNTASMDMRPESPDEYAELDSINVGNGVKLLPVFSGDKFKEIVNYPIIVESWDKKKSGRVKKLWLQQFSDAERKKISGYHARFYRWYLVTGTPERVSVNLTTIELLKKAVHFFATI